MGGGANSFVPFISYAFDIHPSIPTVRGVQRNSRGGGGETEGEGGPRSIIMKSFFL